jgi:DNA integrity scanning protein DisA with diadenylate cyclase activity
VGALFVLGDATAVMERSRQLGINPFYGYSERERNLLDPEVREAVRAFTTLDGAMVIRDDGVVLAAGRYLEVTEEDVKVQLGLAARHMAAAGITAATRATAFAVSQTTGVVRIFRNGHQTMKLAPARRRI